MNSIHINSFATSYTMAFSLKTESEVRTMHKMSHHWIVAPHQQGETCFNFCSFSFCLHLLNLIPPAAATNLVFVFFFSFSENRKNNFCAIFSNCLLPKYLTKQWTPAVQRWSQRQHPSGWWNWKVVENVCAASLAMSSAPALRATIAPNASVWICISGEKFVAIVNVVGISMNAMTTISLVGHNSKFSDKSDRNQHVSSAIESVNSFELNRNWFPLYFRWLRSYQY